MQASSRISHIGRQLSSDIDNRLFKLGLISPILMEIAGQSVATCMSYLANGDRSKRLGILVGPGSRYLIMY